MALAKEIVKSRYGDRTDKREQEEDEEGRETTSTLAGIRERKTEGVVGDGARGTGQRKKGVTRRINSSQRD